MKSMGNCSRCYYAAEKNIAAEGACACARYPERISIADMNNHFCGEFILGEHVYSMPLRDFEEMYK